MHCLKFHEALYTCLPCSSTRDAKRLGDCFGHLDPTYGFGLLQRGRSLREPFANRMEKRIWEREKVSSSIVDSRSNEPA